jgi:hypothetical protein
MTPKPWHGVRLDVWLFASFELVSLYSCSLCGVRGQLNNPSRSAIALARLRSAPEAWADFILCLRVPFCSDREVAIGVGRVSRLCFYMLSLALWAHSLRGCGILVCSLRAHPSFDSTWAYAFVFPSRRLAGTESWADPPSE